MARNEAWGSVGQSHDTPQFAVASIRRWWRSMGKRAYSDARTLFITVYSAEDAIPCSPNPVPNRHQGEVVRGQVSGNIRSTPFDIPMPQMPQAASFFDQQAQA